MGGTESLSVDVRIIAATNKNLEQEVKAERFREDLYYRLNVIPVTLPPLRERREDIQYLVDFFLEKKRLSKNIRFSKEALDLLIQYDYPGNIRELENIIERCVTLAASDIIGKDDLPSYIAPPNDINRQISLSDVAAEAEKGYIIRVLKETKGNKTRAAGMLGISRKTLWEKMNSYGIEA